MKNVTWYCLWTSMLLLIILVAWPAHRARAQPASGYSAPTEMPGLQEKRFTEPFGLEIGGTFSFNAHLEDDDDNKTYNFMFGPSFGVFVAKGLQIGGVPTVLFTKSENGASVSYLAGGLVLFLNYIFDTHTIVFPYLGAGFGAFGGKIDLDLPMSDDTSMNILRVGPNVGIKIVFNRSVTTLSFSYAFNSMGMEDIDDRSEYHEIMLGVGFGLWI